MDFTWAVSLEKLPTKDIKMFEEEAKKLLEKYVAELAVAEAEECSSRRMHFIYAEDWVKKQKTIYEIKGLISDLKAKIEKCEEDDE